MIFSRKHVLAGACAALCLLGASAPAVSAEVWFEDMTWMEVQQRLQSGTRTIIIPTGGVEQNGPHLVNGKHNYIVRFTSEAIAKELGDALIAPVVEFVPEGRISPPEGHMRFPGTISVSEQTFESLIMDIAASFKQHGFNRIALLGDHGGTVEPLRRVAERLNRDWRGQGVKVIHVDRYYGNNGQAEYAEKTHPDVRNPSAHAGFMDTSELKAAYPLGVREQMIRSYDPTYYSTAGVAGDPTMARERYGQALLNYKINAAVEQIRHD